MEGGGLHEELNPAGGRSEAEPEYEPYGHDVLRALIPAAHVHVEQGAQGVIAPLKPRQGRQDSAQRRRRGRAGGGRTMARATLATCDAMTFHRFIPHRCPS